MPRKRPPPSDSPEDPATTESNKKRPSPAEIIALELSTAPDRSTFFSVAGQFAARLACEGFLDAGNTVLLALLEIFPNSQEDIGIYVTQSFEFLWERAGARPPVPWEQPSDEQLAEWEESMRGNWPKSEDKEDVLETMYEMALLGDRNPRPYQLLTAVGLAIELQQTEKAKRLADIEAHYLRDETHNAVWMQVIKYRVLAGIILEGTFKRYASQTAADAQQDADKVVEAIRAWPAKHGERQSARAQRRVELSAAGFDAILKIFEPFKWENEESARRPPASDEAIAAAEERLGLPLPDDYKEFLKISNGMGFLPDLGMPGLRSVESLEWEEFADLGLDEIDADLGLPLDPAEVDKIPKIGRAIMINSEDDEENVWLLEPAQVEATLDIVKKERKQDNYVQEVGWRVGFWTHWTVTTDWYPNFKAYLQAYALEAESKSKQA
ncbi:hypothetical protein DENSPDRAFT_605241 [Dentipellis sp. KUC8613]|nr:hypothetical protein DENSPDRAFT_605241 [Dentipellis sp. KUC8613]